MKGFHLGGRSLAAGHDFANSFFDFVFFCFFFSAFISLAISFLVSSPSRIFLNASRRFSVQANGLRSFLDGLVSSGADTAISFGLVLESLFSFFTSSIFSMAEPKVCKDCEKKDEKASSVKRYLCVEKMKFGIFGISSDFLLQCRRSWIRGEHRD